MNKLVYVMSVKMYKTMIIPKTSGGLGLGCKEEVIKHLNETAGIKGEITDIEIR